MEMDKSLQELEGRNWGEAPKDASPLVVKCHALRRKQISSLTVEELRLLIGQNIGLPFLIPVVLLILKENPLVSGDFYEGDVLETLMGIRIDFWREYPDLKKGVIQIFQQGKNELDELDTTDEIKNDLYKAYEKFISTE